MNYIIVHTSKKGVRTVERVLSDGTRVDLSSLPAHDSPAQWARWSDNYGVSPNRIPELRALLKSKGVRETQFDQTGAAYVEDRQHGRDIVNARGMVDWNAGMRG